MPAVLALLATACAGLELPSELAELAAEAPSDHPVRLVVAGSALRAVAVPLGPGRVPAEVRRVAEIVIPGGETVGRYRVWSPIGDGYRIEKRYPDEASPWRSVLVEPGGRILEQTHSLTVADTPQAVLLAVTGDLRRDVVRVEVVQSGDDREYFRVRTTDTIGRTYLLECDPTGADLAVARIVLTEMAVQR